MLNKLRELRKKNEGFTIIEVVIVLAIAGLIFAIVFVAVPQLQASQRDTSRRSDAGRMTAQVTQDAANNGGTLTTDFQNDILNQMENVGQYNLVSTRTALTDPDDVYYSTAEDCQGNTVGVREFVVMVVLETTTDPYCAEN